MMSSGPTLAVWLAMMGTPAASTGVVTLAPFAGSVSVTANVYVPTARFGMVMPAVWLHAADGFGETAVGPPETAMLTVELAGHARRRSAPW